MTLEAPVSPTQEGDTALGTSSNFILREADLLYSTVDFILERRREIAGINSQIADAYREADQGGVKRHEIAWLLGEVTLSPEKRQEREERDVRREQLWASYVHARQQREAAGPAKVAAAESEAA